MPFDINIQIIPATEQNSGKFYSFGQTRSLGVRGIQKLLNLFAKYLLTPVGSDPLDLTYGTQLPNLLGSNVTPADAQDVLTIAVDKAATWLQGIQRSADIPSDERLLSVTITDFVVLTDVNGFAAQILIRNVSGQGLTLLLPTLQIR